MTAMAAVYIAPASKVLTELHKQDPGAPKGRAKNPASGRDEPYEGVSACGLIMWSGDLWQTVERCEKDRVCPGCVGIVVQEAGLW